MLQEPFSTLQNGLPEQVIFRYGFVGAQINLQERHVSLQKGFSIVHASFSSSRTTKSVGKMFFQICFALFPV
jgi:hypothetical protein